MGCSKKSISFSKNTLNKCHHLCREGLEILLDYNEYRSSNEEENIHAVIHIETIGKHQRS